MEQCVELKIIFLLGRKQAGIVRMWGNQHLHTLLMGLPIGATTSGDSLAVP